MEGYSGTDPLASGWGASCAAKCGCAGACAAMGAARRLGAARARSCTPGVGERHQQGTHSVRGRWNCQLASSHPSCDSLSPTLPYVFYTFTRVRAREQVRMEVEGACVAIHAARCLCGMEHASAVRGLTSEARRISGAAHGCRTMRSTWCGRPLHARVLNRETTSILLATTCQCI